MKTIKLNMEKTVEQNAAEYYELSKKAKQKLERVKSALEETEDKIQKIKEKIEKDYQKEAEKEEKEKNKVTKKQQWYEKYRWFISSEGFLCIGGRDATTNEILIKKHMDENDLIFHTEMAGSPFFIIKSEGKKIGEETIKECAKTTASYSRGWRLGLGTVESYYVKPEQVTKTAKSGEYISKGAFMIYGKKNQVTTDVSLMVGMLPDGRVMAGAEEAVKKNCEKYVRIVPGKEKTSQIAKQIQKKIGGELDEIIKVIPAGGTGIKQ